MFYEVGIGGRSVCQHWHWGAKGVVFVEAQQGTPLRVKSLPRNSRSEEEEGIQSMHCQWCSRPAVFKLLCDKEPLWESCPSVNTSALLLLALVWWQLKCFKQAYSPRTWEVRVMMASRAKWSLPRQAYSYAKRHVLCGKEKALSWSDHCLWATSICRVDIVGSRSVVQSFMFEKQSGGMILKQCHCSKWGWMVNGPFAVRGRCLQWWRKLQEGWLELPCLTFLPMANSHLPFPHFKVYLQGEVKQATILATVNIPCYLTLYALFQCLLVLLKLRQLSGVFHLLKDCFKTNSQKITVPCLRL